jgi:hypothetical protein
MLEFTVAKQGQIINPDVKERMSMDQETIVRTLFYLVPVGAICALIFAFFQSRVVMKFSEGSERMAEIALAIRKGANAYLKRQYTGVGIFFGCPASSV